MKKKYCPLLLLSVLFICGHMNAQNQGWEVDKFEKRQVEKQQARDSTLVRLKNKWEIKASYGRYFFLGQATPTPEDFFSLSKSMNLWQFSTVWHFSEQFFADLRFGIQLERNVPDRPDIFAILNGEDIQIEGSGTLIVPVELGLQYYFTRKRFRPVLGVGNGSVLANSKYTYAEGNINNGLNQTEEIQSTERVWLGRISAGFDYRLGKSSNLSMRSSYYTSGKFDESIGGYQRYRGLVINAGFSIIL